MTVVNDDKKKELLQVHLLYEIEMLKAALKLAQCRCEDKWLQSKIESVVIDLYLIHARNLWQFFFTKDGKSNIAHAGDFLKPSINWLKIVAPLEGTWIKKLKIKVNDYHSHLSYNRKAEPHIDKKWDLVALHAEIKRVFNAFVLNCKDTYLNDEIRNIFN